jgi:anti-sigma-K factor RskA
MTAHPSNQEDLALHALGALPENESAAMEVHLGGCSDCRTELGRLRGDMALLALSVAGPAPPARARARLLNSIRNGSVVSAVPPKRSWWLPAGWALAAAMLIFAALLWNENASLQRRIDTLHVVSIQQTAELQSAREAVATLTATDAMRVTLVAAKVPPQPQGRVIYVQNFGRLIFFASNLPPVPPQKAYELWLLPVKGNPIPAGVFKPDARGSATVVNPPLPVDTEAKGFAITVEPERGSPTPTMPIVIMGTGE